MRSSLLLLTAAVTTVYLMSLILVHLYIHLSLDSTTSDQESALTAAEEGGSSHSITDELLLLRRLDSSDHRSGSALNPIPEDANNNISLETLDRCLESRSVAAPDDDDAAKTARRTAASRQRRRMERLRSRPQRVQEDHLHPSHSRCTDIPRSNEDRDSVAFHPIGEEFLYSAYWDDRIASESPTIRIIALLKKPAKKTDVHFDLFCHVPQSSPDSRQSFQMTGGNGSAAAAVVAASVVSVAATFYEMCENHGKDFGGWILSCRLPADVAAAATSVPPCSVYVSPKSAQPQLNETGVVRLRVLRTRLDPPTAEERGERGTSSSAADDDDRFAVCVPPIFGRIGEKIFTDFVELTRILGADHLFFYVPHPVPPELRSAIDRYVRLGVVTAVPWTIPVPETGVWYSGQLLAINDCLYRSMHAFQYVAFNDMDEFVVPHRHSHWPEMIDALKKTPLTTTTMTPTPKIFPPTAREAAVKESAQTETTYCGYSFKSAFFDPMTESSPGGASAAGHRVDYRLDSNRRTKSFSRIRNKLIVAPSLLFELGIHHISRPLDADKCSVLKVDPKTAFVHHYRECTTSFDGKMNCRALCQDDSMSAFLSVLRS